jgi:trk system potassium uptake protein TrkH
MRKRMSHSQIIALGFLLLIAAGTALLLLPVSTADGQGAPFLTALFTATSAGCVTGLVVVDSGTFWSPFGQTVLLLLIQTGGLGTMTVATLFFRLVRHKVSMRERAVLAESINSAQIGRIVGLTRVIFTGTLLFELGGAVLFSMRFIPQFGLGQGLWFSLFHSVSAFCNAGFDLLGGHFGAYCSLTAYAGDALVSCTVMALITVGGLGFLVWDDLLRRRFRWKRLELHTKLVLTMSGALVFGGAALFFLLERNRMNASLPLGEQVLVSFFNAVTPRTAGFNTVDTAALSSGSKLLTMLLMFIGGSSGSTAGGIKTTTAFVILLYAVAGIRRHRSAYAYGRSIAPDALRSAVIVAVTNLLLMFFGVLLITGVQDMELSDALFECFSAIGTVGMSTGVTRALTSLSRCVVILLMFCGRVGSVSFALALLEKRASPPVTFPVEQITVG